MEWIIVRRSRSSEHYSEIPMSSPQAYTPSKSNVSIHDGWLQKKHPNLAGIRKSAKLRKVYMVCAPGRPRNQRLTAFQLATHLLFGTTFPFVWVDNCHKRAIANFVPKDAAGTGGGRRTVVFPLFSFPFQKLHNLLGREVGDTPKPKKMDTRQSVVAEKNPGRDLGLVDEIRRLFPLSTACHPRARRKPRSAAYRNLDFPLAPRGAIC